MGGASLREKAKIALRAKMGVETKSAIDQKDKEIAELKAKMDKLEAMIMAPRERASPVVVEPHSVQQPSEPTPLPKKRGWPKGKPRKPKETA